MVAEGKGWTWERGIGKKDVGEIKKDEGKVCRKRCRKEIGNGERRRGKWWR